MIRREMIAKLCSLAVFFACSSAAVARAEELAGVWSGVWIKANDPLQVTVTFSKSNDRYAGTFDADALQVTAIPFSEVTSSGAKIRFVLPGDATTAVFEGALAGDVLSGVFKEGEINGTFRLTRDKSPSSPRRREISFANDKVVLAGELILPNESPRDKKYPAIIFLHGSGAEGRWASRYLAQRFAAAGFVALIYDKRGAGASSGDWQKSSLEEIADDAVAGFRFLAQQAEVDPSRIGVYGHSQGGTIAGLVTARAEKAAFVIAAAASGLDPAEVEIYSVENHIGASRLPKPERADARRFVKELVEVAYRGKDRAELDALVRRFRGRTWFFEPPPPDASYWALSKKVARFDPLVHWRRVRAPVLLTYGALDERVPPQKSIQAIRAARPEVSVKIFEHADHAFWIVPVSPPGGWPKHVPDYVDTLLKFARRHTTSKK